MEKPGKLLFSVGCIVRVPRSNPGMSHRMRFVAKTACAILAVLGLVLLLFRTSSAPPGTPIAWQLQPDSFPMGTVLQGSRVEMSLGLFSGLKPAPMPTFLTSLPPPLSKAADWTVEQFRTTAAKLSLRAESKPQLS